MPEIKPPFINIITYEFRPVRKITNSFLLCKNHRLIANTQQKACTRSLSLSITLSHAKVNKRIFFKKIHFHVAALVPQEVLCGKGVPCGTHTHTETPQHYKSCHSPQLRRSSSVGVLMSQPRGTTESNCGQTDTEQLIVI